MGSDGPQRPGKRGRRNDVPWNDIRAAFEQDGETNLTALSKRFGVSRRLIIARRDRERWAGNTNAETKEREQFKGEVRNKVVDIATRRAIEQIQADGGEEIVQQAVTAITELVDQTGPLLKKAGELLDAKLDRAIKNQISTGLHQGESGVTVDLLNATSKFVRDVRSIAGLKEGQANNSVSEAKETPKADQLVLVVRETKTA